MDKYEQVESLFHSTFRDAYSWVDRAEKHLIVSEIIHNELFIVLENHPDIPDEITQKVMALLESYLLLCGLAFENLVKGLIISIKPDFNDKKELNAYKWNTKGGHGIKEMFDYNFQSLDETEKELIERLEEFLIWAGKYEIPLESNKYIKSKFPKNLENFKSTDKIVAESIFEKIKLVIEKNWEQNEKLYWNWKDKYFSDKIAGT